MRSDDLTREQARVLKEKLQPMLGYLRRLQKRMHKCGFHQNDKLYQLVNTAYDSMQALNVEVHYLACGDVVGRKSPHEE